MPGWWLFRRLNRGKVPAFAVIAVSVAALIITIPALWSTDAAPTFPWAFFAITGICTVGLYIAYTIPIYLRLRAGRQLRGRALDPRAAAIAGSTPPRSSG